MEPRRRTKRVCLQDPLPRTYLTMLFSGVVSHQTYNSSFCPACVVLLMLSPTPVQLETPPLDARREPFKTISFSGSGWLFPYQIGVASALRDSGIITYSSDSAAPITRCVGASGGALVAMGAAIDLDPTVMKAAALRGYDEVMKTRGPWGALTEVTPTVRQTLLDHESEIVNAASKIAERRLLTVKSVTNVDDPLPRWLSHGINHHLAIYITVAEARWPFLRSVQRDRFASFADLVEALVASSADLGLPRRLKRSQRQVVFDEEECGWPRSTGRAAAQDPSDAMQVGPLVMDGAITSFQPLLFEKDRGLVLVSPLWWQFWAHIRPRYLPTLWALCPPRNRRQYEALCAFGYRDGIEFATLKGCISRDAAESLLMSHPQCADPELMALQPSPLLHAVPTAAIGITCGALCRVLYRRLRRRP